MVELTREEDMEKLEEIFDWLIGFGALFSVIVGTGCCCCGGAGGSVLTLTVLFCEKTDAEPSLTWMRATVPLEEDVLTPEVLFFVVSKLFSVLMILSWLLL